MVYQHFNRTMRMELSILRKKGYSLRDIAKVLGVHVSSVSRELKKNYSPDLGCYDPLKANQKAYVKRKYSKYQGMKICGNPWLEDYVKQKLKAGWTPEQISGRLQVQYGKALIGFKIIYKWIYSSHGQAYAKFLPSQRFKPKRRRKKKTKRTLIPNRVFINLRPQVIDDRERPGDFEGDTLGKPRGTSQVLVATVERYSRCIFARKVASLKRSMEDGFQKILRNLQAHSLTLDNGVENVRYESLGIPTFFCHPHAAWEKGTIENSFQRLRRYIPKRANLAHYSHEYIAFVVNRMNNTPRKCLGFRTPAEIFKERSQSNLSSVALRGTM